MKNNFFCYLFLYILAFTSNHLAKNIVSGDSINYKKIENINYYDKNIYENDTYIKERCKLDIYFPTNKNNYATVVWFHGGGLKTGEKFIPEILQNKGIAVVAVNYRFNPKVISPAYIEDAAASVAWVFNNIQKYGGNKKLIFVTGHSAGGYLTSMIGMDKKWLAKFNIDADSIAGLIPFSGHTITHFTVREERGIPGEQPIIDDLAPLYFVRINTPPIVLITGDRNLEMLGRYEENAYFYRMLKVVGNNNVDLFELQGFDHVGMAEPAYYILLKQIYEISSNIMK